MLKVLREKFRLSLESREGFTLIELLAVIAIIGILASVVFGVIGSARASARDARRALDLRQINNAIQLYILDHGRAPLHGSACGGVDRIQTVNFEGNYACAVELRQVLGPYLSTVPTDPCPDCDPYYGRDSGGYIITGEDMTPTQSEDLRYYYRPMSVYDSDCSAGEKTCDRTGYVLDVSAFETRSKGKPYLYIFGFVYDF